MASTKATLIANVNANYADNTTGDITPLDARTTETEEINSWQQAPLVNSQVGVSGYTVVTADYGKLIIFNNATAVSVALPGAGTPSFFPFNVMVKNEGVGTVTITPTVGLVDGALSLNLLTGQSTWLLSDATNWRSVSGSGGGGSPGGSATELQYRAGPTTFGAIAGSSWDGSTLAFKNLITIAVPPTSVPLPGIPTASNLMIVSGSTASPVTDSNVPTVAIIREQNQTGTGPQDAALYVHAMSHGTTQPVGITGVGFQVGTGDALGIAGLGACNSSIRAVGFGAYFEGRANGPLTGAIGIESTSINNSGSDRPHDPVAGNNLIIGYDIVHDGGAAANLGGPAVQIRTVRGKWDVGLAFLAQSGTDGIKTAAIQDDSAAATVLLMHGGTHVNGIDFTGATYSANQIKGIGFNFDVAGNLSSNGVINANTGYRWNGTAPLGQVLRGDGSNFVAAALTTTDISGARRVITAADVTAGVFNVYVNGTTGNDSNPGTSASPFATIQKGIDYVCGSIDAQFFDVTINVAAGTYTQSLVLRPFLGSGVFRIKGDTTTPANCLISTTNAACIQASGGNVRWTIEGLKFQTNGSGTTALNVDSFAVVSIGYVEFGSMAGGYFHMQIVNGGTISTLMNPATNNGWGYRISGDAGAHMNVDGGGRFINFLNSNIDMVGLRTFGGATGVFVSGFNGSLVVTGGCVYRRTDQSNKIRRTAAGNTTSGSNSISGLVIAGTDTSSLFVGMYVLCRDTLGNLIFPIGTTITAISTSTSVTVSNNATANQTGISIGFEIAVGKKYNAQFNAVVTGVPALPGNNFGTNDTGGQIN